MNPARLRISSGVSWAGLALGPGCWALDTQLNYALVDTTCRHGWHVAPVVAAVLVAVSLAGALSSWLAWHRHDGPGMPLPEQDGHPRHLLSGIGVASGVLFALVIAMQGLAALILSPCLR
jgi:hypothetical protein